MTGAEGVRRRSGYDCVYGTVWHHGRPVGALVADSSGIRAPRLVSLWLVWGTGAGTGERLSYPGFPGSRM